MPTQLLASENLVLPPRHRHGIVIVRTLLPAVLATALPVLVVDVAARRVVPADLRLLVTVGAAALLGLWVLAALVRWEGDSLTVTDQRVVLEEGVFQRCSRAIPLNRVQDVATAQSLLGRLLDYGTVEIDAAGAGGAERFTYVRGPQRVRDQVFALIGRLSRGL